MDNHAAKHNINQNSKWTIVKQFLNNIDHIDKNICGFKAHDKAIYTSGPYLLKPATSQNDPKPAKTKRNDTKQHKTSQNNAKKTKTKTKKIAK